jgi:hypothetical protein
MTVGDGLAAVNAGAAVAGAAVVVATAAELLADVLTLGRANWAWAA